MTPEQALQILDNACAQAAMSRMDHWRVQQAVEVLRQAIMRVAEDKPEVT